ncbi:MAG: D-tyrosyl-tRNA(Tyr) deacylase [Muribaculaceae bacterium]|nr:D-tyrosyl-tRNA(Tyr) deacylase [Muribaculaceae bacterium]
MKIVIQRVSRASVTVEGKLISSIGEGMLILVGVSVTDTEEDVEWVARKTAGLRIFDDAAGVMNLSVVEKGGDLLAVSQFTLLASTRKGNRPSYVNAAGHDLAVPLYNLYCSRLGELTGKDVAKGVFGADMKVDLLNNGPVTIVIDSKLRE